MTGALFFNHLPLFNPALKHVSDVGVHVCTVCMHVQYVCDLLGLPISGLVRARGMTGVGSISILLQGFGFTTAAKWDARKRARLRKRVHVMWLSAK